MALGTHSLSTRWSASDGVGSDGTEASDAAAKLKVPLRSPTTPRRHAEMLGASTPKRVSSSLSIEVWSKTSLDTSPPRVNGEHTIIGTRKPSPIGPATPLASAGSGETLMYSPGVP